MLKHHSIPGLIVDLILLNKIIPIVNNDILNEYYDVLCRPRFKFAKEDIDNVMVEIRKKALFIEPKSTNETFIDEDDKVFYDIVIAARGEMDAYLLTGNIKHFPKREFIITPRQMIDIIKKHYDKA